MGLSTVGGGLTNSKLALATASVSDVLSSKTFYSGDKNIKTGGMVNRGAWNSSVVPGSSVTVPQGYHNGAGKVTANKASVVQIVNSTGQIAHGFWDLNYSRTFNAAERYCGFIVIVVARNLSPLYNTKVSVSSGYVSEVWLRAIAMEDDITYDHAKTFMVNNVTLPCTLSLSGSGGSGWGYIIYGVR